MGQGYLIAPATADMIGIDNGDFSGNCSSVSDCQALAAVVDALSTGGSSGGSDTRAIEDILASMILDTATTQQVYSTGYVDPFTSDTFNGAYDYDGDGDCIHGVEPVTDDALSALGLASSSPASGVSVRQRILANGGLSTVRSKVRVQFTAGSTGATVIHASIGVAASNSDTVSTPVQLKFSGSNGITVGNGESFWSDWTDFSYDPSAAHIVVSDYDTDSSIAYATYNGAAGYYKSGETWNEATPSGMSSSSETSYGVNAVEICDATTWTDIDAYSDTITLRADDPTGATVVLDIEPGGSFDYTTMLGAQVSIDGGTHKHSVTIDSVPMRDSGTRLLVRGDVSSITARTANDAVLYVTTYGTVSEATNCCIHGAYCTFKW